MPAPAMPSRWRRRRRRWRPCRRSGARGRRGRSSGRWGGRRRRWARRCRRSRGGGWRSWRAPSGTGGGGTPCSPVGTPSHRPGRRTPATAWSARWWRRRWRRWPRRHPAMTRGRVRFLPDLVRCTEPPTKLKVVFDYEGWEHFSLGTETEQLINTWLIKHQLKIKNNKKDQYDFLKYFFYRIFLSSLEVCAWKTKKVRLGRVTTELKVCVMHRTLDGKVK